jgi:CBS domain-containing protein
MRQPPYVVTKSINDTTERISRAGLRREKVSVLTTREPLTVQAGTTLRETIRRMQRVSGEPAVVCQGDRVVGIVTERDILMRVLGRPVDLDGPVDAVMTTQPYTLDADSSVADALDAMDQGGFRNLLLTDGAGTLAGLLRQQDVIEYVAEAFPQEILNLPPRPHQTMEEPEGA